MISVIKLFLAYLNGFSNEGNKVFVFTESLQIICATNGQYRRNILSQHPT